MSRVSISKSEHLTKEEHLYFKLLIKTINMLAKQKLTVGLVQEDDKAILTYSSGRITIERF